MTEESVLFPDDFIPPDERPIKEIPFCGDMMGQDERKARIKLDEVSANLTSAEAQVVRLTQLINLLSSGKTEGVSKEKLEENEKKLTSARGEENAWLKNQNELTEQKEKLEPIIAELEKPRLEQQQLVRLLLERAGIETGQQIMDIGCTGLYKILLEKKLFDSPAAAQERVQWVHLNLGGSRLGLTCYVPLSRYCLVHSTIGGLEENQEQQFADQVPHMSRELNPEEKGHVALVQAARRRGGADTTESMRSAKELLAGRVIPADVPIVGWGERNASGGLGGLVAEPASAEDNANVALAKVNETLKEVGLKEVPQPWRCPEHNKTIWSCRFCIAQAIVDGPLVPRMVLENVGEGKVMNETPPEDVEKRVADSDASQVRLYAQVGSWTRRLARDEESEE